MVLPLIQIKRLKRLPGNGPCRESDFFPAAINVMSIMKAVPWHFGLKTKSGQICQMEGSKIWIECGNGKQKVYHILGTVDELVNLANFPASRPGSALGFNPKLHPVKPTDIEEVEAEYLEEKPIWDVNLYDDDDDEDDEDDEDEEDY